MRHKNNTTNMKILKLVDGSEHLITEKEHKIILSAVRKRTVFYLPRIELSGMASNMIIRPVNGQLKYGKPYLIFLKNYGKSDEDTVFRAFLNSGKFFTIENNQGKEVFIEHGSIDDIEKANGEGSIISEDDYYDEIGMSRKTQWPNTIILGSPEEQSHKLSNEESKKIT